MARKPGKGRKKTQLKKIDNVEARVVTFCKRRTGLFKKAGEIATLCGAQIAVILFSISGKPFSFGSPDIQSVIERFLNVNEYNKKEAIITGHINSCRESRLHQLNQQFNDLNEQLAKEKKRGQLLQEVIKGSIGKTYEEYINGLDMPTLKELKQKLEEVKKNLGRNGDEASVLSSSEHKIDLSKLEIPRDYLKL